MTRRTIVAFAAVWTVSVVGTALLAQSDRQAVPESRLGQTVGPIITGADNIGFQRVAAQGDPGKVVGKWMVKINGVWLETQSPIGITR